MMFSDDRPPRSLRVVWLPRPPLEERDDETCSRKLTSCPVASSYSFLEFSILLSCQ